MADWPYNTARWQRLRRLKLSSSPICEDCERIGIIRPAQAVDHRDPISAGGEPFPDLDKLASLCNSCHSAKTARGVEAGAVRTTKPRARKGCDAHGNPLDPTHPWNTKNRSELSLQGPPRRFLLSYPEVSDDGR